MCVAVKCKKTISPIIALPDGRYSLNHPGNEDWDLKVTHCKSRKHILLKQGPEMGEEPVSYDDDIPLYISWGNGMCHITELAIKNIRQVSNAINKKTKVYLTISSRTINLMD